jgi:hypothetical protein
MGADTPPHCICRRPGQRAVLARDDITTTPRSRSPAVAPPAMDTSVFTLGVPTESAQKWAQLQRIRNHEKAGKWRWRQS